MSLAKLINNSRTDKNTRHTYLETYQKLFDPKKNIAKNVLEIGIWHGGSIKLWNDFFTNARIHATDIMHINEIWNEIKNDKITLYTSSDAYSDSFFKINFLDKNIKCDVLIDDGPHTLESMKKFITLYSQIMTDDGILIIEDIQEWDWIETLKTVVPKNLKPYIQIYDLRAKKNRYDDILFVINKSKNVNV